MPQPLPGKNRQISFYTTQEKKEREKHTQQEQIESFLRYIKINFRFLLSFSFPLSSTLLFLRSPIKIHFNGRSIAINTSKLNVLQFIHGRRETLGRCFFSLAQQNRAKNHPRGCV